MSPKERKIFRDTIRNVAHQNRNRWWELKRQIWDFGYQSYYPMQDEFRYSAELAISQLPQDVRNELGAILASRLDSQVTLNERDISKEYAPLIVEEIVRRAGIAAYRTVNW